MKKLNIGDNLFIVMDNEEEKAHVLSCFMLEKPKDYTDDYIETLVKEVRNNPWPLPHFRERIARSITSLGFYYWEPVTNMDMAHHVKCVDLHGKGTEKDLEKAAFWQKQIRDINK